MTEDFYDVLDVPGDASQEEIRSAFRDRVRVYHPDLNDDERAQAQFTVVKTAYDVLGDPVERRAYDRLGHADYVAKRTSGLPSPDQWGSFEDEETEDGEASAREEDRSGVESTHVGWERTVGPRSEASASSATAARGDGGATMDARTTTVGGTRRHHRGSRIARWFRRRNAAWPLLGVAAVVYLAGLAAYALDHGDGLADAAAAIQGAPQDVAHAWNGLVVALEEFSTPVGYAVGAGGPTPPIDPVTWYGSLVGLVVVTAVSLFARRVYRSRGPFEPPSMGETVAFAFAVGVASGLVGGPLLAGAALLPICFGVVVFHSRRLRGWSPSYLYVLAVSTPAVGLVAGAAGVRSVPLELAAFVVLPLCGVLGLPLRVAIRRRFGR